MTTTLTLTAAEIKGLERKLRDARFDFKPLQHAHFQARGPGVVVNAYRSGKVVVQGKGAEAFLETHGLAEPAAPGITEPVAGSDESGKGDYFGPLVVAAVVVAPGVDEDLARAGVRDCKQMGDNAILRAAKAIRDVCPHAVRALTPPEYNARHEEDGNVAIFLSALHAEALGEAIEAAPACARIVIDKFTSTERLEKALHAEGIDLPVEIRHRAEDNPAVAAASVLARAEFLIGLRELGGEFGVQLPKGAGEPVERAARRFFRDYGMDALSAVAKIHFKTTKKVTERLF
jgi:ribonuclease HIII